MRRTGGASGGRARVGRRRLAGASGSVDGAGGRRDHGDQGRLVVDEDGGGEGACPPPTVLRRVRRRAVALVPAAAAGRPAVRRCGAGPRPVGVGQRRAGACGAAVSAQRAVSAAVLGRRRGVAASRSSSRRSLPRRPLPRPPPLAAALPLPFPLPVAVPVARAWPGGAGTGRWAVPADARWAGSAGASSVTMTPRPLQHSHCCENASSSPAPTRLRVICTRPSEVTSATWCLVRSLARHSSSRRSTSSRFDSSTMSMKSMTTMPPMSRSRSWRTISSAASRLFLVTVSSRLPPWPVNFPVLTSTTVIASVRSMTSEPPLGSHTLRSSALASCSSMR